MKTDGTLNGLLVGLRYGNHAREGSITPEALPVFIITIFQAVVVILLVESITLNSEVSDRHDASQSPSDPIRSASEAIRQTCDYLLAKVPGS